MLISVVGNFRFALSVSIPGSNGVQGSISCCTIDVLDFRKELLL